MQDNALYMRIRALIFFRALFVTLLLGSLYLFKIDYLYTHPDAIAYLIITLYTLTIAYSLLITRIKHLFVFGYLQLFLDVLSGIALVTITGGIESWFSFTLILTVMSSSMILNKKAGYIMASLSSLLYGALLNLQFYGIIPIPFEMAVLGKQLLYNVFIHVLALYVTAFLAGNLSHRLERTVQKLEEQDTHLKELELFNEKVLESLPSGLFTTDMAGTVLIFNRAAQKITGKDKDSVIGHDIFAPLPFLPRPLSEGRMEGILHQKNRDRIIAVDISVLNDSNGNATGFIGVFQDMTQIKNLEAEIKEKEKWAAVGELSANIAHEIRNPLASMKSSIEMLREDRLSGMHRETLMTIALKEMDRLNGIITDFLTYSKPKPAEMLPVDIHLLLDETLALLKAVVGQQGRITIIREIEGTCAALVDPQQIKQVFWNLGINAIEAMPDGGRLAISSRYDDETVSISFADTGMGIPGDNLEKIFYPFFTTKETGSGLGLSIAYRIVSEHRGRLQVRSTPGIETVFEIILKRS